MHRHFFLLPLLLMIAILPLASQETPASNPPLTTIRKESELVLVPVIVTDKKNNPVSGLTRDSFHIMEDGKHKEIAVFEEMHTAPEPVTVATPTNGEFTNTLETSRNGRITIIMIDLLNTPYDGQVRVREDSLKFLAEHLDPGEPVALLSLGPEGLRVLHDFSTDGKDLAAAIRKIKPGMSSQEKQTWAAATGRNDSMLMRFRYGPLNQDEFATQEARARFGTASGFMGLTQLQRIPLEYAPDDAYQLTLESLRLVADAFASVPGRKTLIWATGGIPDIADMPNRALVSRRDYSLYQSTWNSLSSANIAVYPLDLQSLGNPYYVPPSIANRRRPQSTMAISNMEEFARSTGGRLCIAKMDIENCFRTAAKDSSDYYEVAYYTDPNGPDRWRKIRVFVSPDTLKIRARTGFFHHRRDETVNTRDVDLGLAVTTPIDSSAIPLRAHWVKQTAKNEKRAVEFEVTVPASSFQIDYENRNRIGMELFALPKTIEGKAQPGSSKRMEGDVPAAEVAGFPKQMVTWKGELELSPGMYEVRFVVRDEHSGKIGTLTAPLKVED